MADPDTQPLQSDESAPLPWQKAIFRQQVERLSAGQLPHALMLSGPAGVGKTAFAAALAARILCGAPQSLEEGGQACGQCKQCLLIRGEGHPDARWVAPTDKSRVIRIHQIRALSGLAMESPQVARRKVMIVATADRLNASSANALLKTLEEPPADTFLILLHRSGQSVLPTIRSRCQNLRLEAPEPDMALQWLAEHAPDTDQETHQLALLWAAQAPMEAKRLLDEGLLEKRRECLSALQRYLKSEILPGEAVRPFLSMPIEQALDLLLEWARDLARAGASPEHVQDSEAAPMLGYLAGRHHPVYLHRLYEATLQARRGLEYNVNPEMELTVLLDQWQALMRSGRGLAKRA